MIELKQFNTIEDALELIFSLINHINAFDKKEAELEAENLRLKAEIQRLKGDDPDPITPSGMIPPYKKKDGKGDKIKPGRKNGHEGSRREAPEAIDNFVEHELAQCPDCGCPLCKTIGKRKRIIEDISVTRPEVTEHTINRYYCKNCRKTVEPIITEALPNAQIGLKFLVTTARLHFGLGMTVGNIVKWADGLSRFKITPGGLTQMWFNFAERLRTFYDIIQVEVRRSPNVKIDETGWRVMGQAEVPRSCAARAESHVSH